MTRLRKKLLKKNKSSPSKLSKDRIGLCAEITRDSAIAAVTDSRDNKQKGEAVQITTQSSNLNASCVLDVSLHCGVTDSASIENLNKSICYVSK